MPNNLKNISFTQAKVRVREIIGYHPIYLAVSGDPNSQKMQTGRQVKQNTTSQIFTSLDELLIAVNPLLVLTEKGYLLLTECRELSVIKNHSPNTRISARVIDVRHLKKNGEYSACLRNLFYYLNIYTPAKDFGDRGEMPEIIHSKQQAFDKEYGAPFSQRGLEKTCGLTQGTLKKRKGKGE